MSPPSAGMRTVETDLTKEGAPPAAPRTSRRGFSANRRRVAALTSVALILAAIVAALVWWFVSPPLSTATEWGGIGRESVIVGIRTENGGRFDLRITDVAAEGRTSAARLRSVGIRSSPTAPRVQSFAPLTLRPGEHTYVVLTYRVLCDEVASSRAALGGVDIRYEVFGVGRTKHIANVTSAPELSLARACD